jgi:hypothetical protein
MKPNSFQFDGIFDVSETSFPPTFDTGCLSITVVLGSGNQPVGVLRKIPLAERSDTRVRVLLPRHGES